LPFLFIGGRMREDKKTIGKFVLVALSGMTIRDSYRYPILSFLQPLSDPIAIGSATTDRVSAASSPNRFFFNLLGLVGYAIKITLFLF